MTKATIKGFSLLELCAVMVIAGLVMSAVAGFIRINYQARQATETYDKIRLIETALNNYLAFTSITNAQRLPCPARLTLSEGEAATGLEDCPNGDPAHDALLIMTDGRATTATGALLPDRGILIGAVPYATLKQALAGLSTANITALGGETALDSWGNKILYAVTRSMTKPNTYNESHGTISVETEHSPPQPLVTPAGSLNFILLSHGPDGVGAYNRVGKITKPCAGAAKDVENCNNNDRFVQGVLSEAPGATHYDDISFFRPFTKKGLWERVKNTTYDIHNLNPGFVGVGTAAGDQPEHRLDINGSLRGMSATAAGDAKLMVGKLCDTEGNNCFEPKILGGEGIKCAPSNPATKVSLMRGISLGNVVCEERDLPTAISGSCDPGEFVVGIDFFGKPVCNSLTPSGP